MKLQKMLDELEDFRQDATLYVSAPTPIYITGELEPYPAFKDRLALVYSVQRPKQLCLVRDLRLTLKSTINRYFLNQEQNRDWFAHKQTMIHLGTHKYTGCSISRLVPSPDGSQVFFVPGIPDFTW